MIEWNTGTLGNYYVRFTDPALCGKQQKTIWLWFEALDLSAETIATMFTDPTPGTNEYWYITKSLSASGRIEFFQNFTTAYGRWYLPAISAGTLYNLAVTYDAGSVSNDPIMYLNGAAQTVTEDQAPVGTYHSGTGASMYLGTPVSNSKHLRIYAMCYYDRLFSADEVLDGFKNRLAIPSRRGLVFAPILWGCEGRQEFNNLTLTGTDFILDPISRALGTPNGSPVGYGLDHLTLGE